MISTFNLSKLNSLLRDFHNITKLRITVFDDSFRELTAYPEHIAPCCQIIRTDPKAAAACADCDAHACEMAARSRSAYTYRCHAGLTESIAPLTLGNIVIGYLLFGHVFSYPTHEEGWKSIRENCASYCLDQEALRAACFSCPIIPEDYIASVSHIMQAVASYLCLERMAIVQREELPVRIDEYISMHFTEEISVPDLCRHFQIGKTRLYEISDQNYGCGIAEHIRNLRIEKAKALLTEHPERKVSEIASACGFSDYNYFITVFKRLAGISPGQYRAEMKQNFTLSRTNPSPYRQMPC